MDLIAALLPSLGLGLLFWFVIRAMLRADRTEREEAARFERESRAEQGRDIP